MWRRIEWTLPSWITPSRAANIVLQQILDAKYITTVIAIRILLTLSVELSYFVVYVDLLIKYYSKIKAFDDAYKSKTSLNLLAGYHDTYLLQWIDRAIPN